MRSNRHWLRSAALAGLVLSGGTISLAQQPERTNAADAPQRTIRQTERGQATRAQGEQTGATANARSDGTLAACLIIDNNKEIALSKLAQQHAQNDEVKAFAEKMIKDHQKFVQELQQTASAAGYQEQQLALSGAESGERANAASDTPRPRANRDTDTAQSRTGRPADSRRAARPSELDSAQSGEPVDFIALKQEVAEKCLQSAREEMTQNKSEFDMHYMGAQIMAHQGMVDTLAVFAQHASPELQSTLEQGQKTAQEHLEHAKKIKEQLAKASSDSSEKRDSKKKD